MFNVSTDYLLDFQVDTFAPLSVSDNKDESDSDGSDVPKLSSELTKDEKKLLLYYRTIEDKKAFLEHIEAEYYKKYGKKGKK